MANLIDGAGGVLLFVLLAIGWHYAAYNWRNEWKLLGYVFFLMFVVRWNIAVLNTVFQVLPLQMEALRYDAAASAVSDLIRSGQFGVIFSSEKLLSFVEPGYTIPLGFFYFVFGRSVLVGFILNTFLFSLTALNVYRIGNLISGPKGAMLAAFSFLILPYSMLHSTYLYRDPWVNFFMSEFFYRLLLVSRGERQSALQWLWIAFVLFWLWNAYDAGRLAEGKRSAAGAGLNVADAKAAGAATINYGLFINTIIGFVIVAFVIFLLVRGINRDHPRVLDGRRQ